VLFRVVAVLLALLPFAAGELFLRAVGWGRAHDGDDPFVGFTKIHPLFVLSDDGQRFEISSSRQRFFRPDSFAAKKDPREFRIFCLGGSTVQGNPYTIETAFTTWLELSLQAADPRRDWQVVNCGGISYASYRLTPILEELLAHQPDLFILYTGHNEFLEDRTYDHIKQTPRWIVAASATMAHSRLYNVFRQGVQHASHGDDPPPPKQPQLPAEVDAVLDHYGGLSKYRRDDDRARLIIDHYETNLRRMIALAHTAGVPVIVCNPVSNLNDCPPFKSEHSAELSDPDRQKFRDLWETALATNNPQQQEELLLQALALDDRHAAVHYHRAQCLELQHRYEEAKAEYLRAKEEDVCPLRMLEPLHAVLDRVTRDTHTPKVDVRRLFEEASPHGIPGEKLLIDHVHPRIRGHQMIADALLTAMAEQGWVAPSGDWRPARDAAYQRQLASLEYGYFVRGEEHLHGLRLWTQGRARPGKRTFPPIKVSKD
jgi:lysophospholipase L1-like esterase